ncbi:lipoate--protein ligase [Mycoplasmoides pirum]|uniref:lipoate--protein ligase n=1 Tax=Mycoplasmoides pirum TaxID=2122 RepID=UPI0004808C65|nr:lipoate--protein ligase [Mycoplasmoides pirum]
MSWFLSTSSLNPYINAATEEYLLKNFDSKNEPIIYLWRNDNTIVIGRNQNPLKEINLESVQNDHVNLFRRLSGGGTVYHDLGNLNYSFINKTNISKPNSYKDLAIPIIDFLNSIGVKAEFKGRNDIEIDGKKISGNAQYIYQDKLLHHGTLLFSLNQNKLSKYLNVDPSKIQAKGIDSIKKRITNISEHLPRNFDWDIDIFIDKISNWFLKNNDCKPIVLDEFAKKIIEDRAKNHFSSWDWNYGNLDEATFLNKKRFQGGNLEVYLIVKNGLIKKINFIGDFLSVKDINDLEEKFVNKKYNIQQVNLILSQFDLKDYFGQISKNEILTVMFDNGK